MTLVYLYAPIQEAEEESKEIFYDEVQIILNNTPKHDMLIVLGDCNIKVDEEQIYENVAGKYSLHVHTNNNGKRLFHPAEANQLIIASTFFDHKRIHKATWTPPDGRITNQIDHVLVNKCKRSNILDVRSFRGANCDSDRMLVGVRIKQKISKYFRYQNKMYMEKWDVDK